MKHQLKFKLPDFSLGKEWALLELLALGLYSDAEQELFAQFLNTKDLNWQLLLQQAKRHKIICLLALSTLSTELENVLPEKIKTHLSSALLLNKQKLKLYRQSAAKIVRAFNRQNIVFVGTKGIALESSIYRANNSRIMSDIDFVILSQDRKNVALTLAELGYEMGIFNPNTQVIEPHSRELLIKYKLNPDHLPSHVKLTDNILIPFVEVDIANSLTWTLCPFQIPTEIALQNIIYRAIPGSENRLPVFSLPFQFISTILHLFKEAWVEITLEMQGKDVNLSKFSDIIRLWRSHHHELDIEEFVGILEAYALTQPVLWVLEHLDRTFNLDIVESLGLQSRVTESWLHSASNSRQWQGTMRQRLASFNRQRLFI